MEEALQFFRALEGWIYLLLGLAALYFIRRFILAWQELREAAFGMERESAQARLNQATIVLVFLLAMVISEFVLVSFIAPAMPGAVPLPTPTLNLLASPTTTLPAGAVENLLTTTTPISGTLTASTPTAVISGSACIPGQIEISAPTNASPISGVVEIIGTANTPNFGFYKLEMRPSEDPNWLTVLAGNEVRINAVLGVWNTSLLTPGSHQLSLVVTDNQGQSQPPCIVQVNITLPVETQQP